MTDHHRNTPSTDSHDIDSGLPPLPTPKQRASVTDAPPQQRESAIDAPVVRESLDAPERLPETPRWSTHNRKPVDRF